MRVARSICGLAAGCFLARSAARNSSYRSANAGARGLGAGASPAEAGPCCDLRRLISRAICAENSVARRTLAPSVLTRPIKPAVVRDDGVLARLAACGQELDDGIVRRLAAACITYFEAGAVADGRCWFVWVSSSGEGITIEEHDHVARAACPVRQQLVDEPRFVIGLGQRDVGQNADEVMAVDDVCHGSSWDPK